MTRIEAPPGQAPSDKPALEPYWGKPAVRNLRGDDGNVGIIRSPVRAIVLPDHQPGRFLRSPPETPLPMPRATFGKILSVARRTGSPQRIIGEARTMLGADISDVGADLPREYHHEHL